MTLLLFPSSPTSCFGVGSPEGEDDDGPAWEEPAAPPDVFSGPARCPAPYTFSFEMLVTGPCLLAGAYPTQGSWEIAQGLAIGTEIGILRTATSSTMVHR